MKQRGKDLSLWKGCLGVEQVVASGMKWNIGDGREISIWDDRWLTNQTGGKPVSSRPINTTFSKVSDLIDQQHNNWKRQVVLQTFQIEEAHQILQIPLQVHHQQDQLVWSMETKGKFTVKSAYQFACSLRK